MKVARIVTSEQVTEKQCTKCHEVKPLSEFFSNSKNPDGKQYLCKICRRDYQKQYRGNAQAKFEEKLTLPLEGEKLCSKCNEIKSLSEFTRNRYNKDGFHHHCKTCFYAHTKNYNKIHPLPPRSYPQTAKKWQTRFKETHGYSYLREVRLRRNYGLTIEDYNRMLEAQGFCCAICGISQSELDRGLSVDHDHVTGKVRALLCTMCNVTLGYVEKAFSLGSYITYLQVHGSLCSVESNTSEDAV